MATFLRRVLVYVRPYRMQSLLLIVGMLLDLLFDTALRLSFKFLIDEALIPQNYSLLLSLLAGLSSGIVIAAIAAVGRDYLYARLGTRVVNDLRTALFTHLQGLSMPFYSHTPTGEIMARFATDLAAVEYALVQGLPVGLFAVLGLVLAVVPLFLLAWPLALLAVVTLPLCLLGPRLLKQRTFAASYHLKEAQARVVNAVQENVGAQPVVKAFSLQGTALEGFRRQMTTLINLSTRANFLSYLMERTRTSRCSSLNSSSLRRALSWSSTVASPSAHSSRFMCSSSV